MACVILLAILITDCAPCHGELIIILTPPLEAHPLVLMLALIKIARHNKAIQSCPHRHCPVHAFDCSAVQVIKRADDI